MKKNKITKLVAVAAISLFGVMMNPTKVQAEAKDCGNIQYGQKYEEVVYDSVGFDEQKVKYHFQLKQSSTVYFNIQIPDDGEEVDFGFRIYDSHNDLLADESDYMTYAGKQTYKTWLLGGEYTIVFYDGTMNGMGLTRTEFNFSAKKVESKETFKETVDEQDDTESTANKISEKANIKGFVAKYNDFTDVYKFKMTKTGKYVLTYKGKCKGKIKLNDTWGEVSYEVDANNGKTYSFLIPKGTYYLTFSPMYAGTYSFKTTYKEPTKTAVKSVTKNKQAKTISVRWTRKSDVGGYQIQLSNDKKFSKNVKKCTINDYASYQQTIAQGNLQLGKKVYIRIRTFKNVSSVDGKARYVYSNWSPVVGK